MKRFSSRHQLTTLSELNITPLLDLAFVLLIIFMITTPLMETKSNLVVPTTKRAADAVDPSQVETISIDKDAVVSINGAEVARDALGTTLSDLKAAHPGVAVIVRAHHELPVQKLVDIMDALKQVGITKIGVVSTSAEGQSKP
ncbi:MAG: biopolymer transporter ExbD [Verrucomicrobiota bacterium]